jgi:hypothetical protein
MCCWRLASSWCVVGPVDYRRPIVNRLGTPACQPSWRLGKSLHGELTRVALDHIRYFRLADSVNSADHPAQFRRHATGLFFLIQIQLHLEVNVRPRHFPMIR